ncbi:class I SAM-dependent methyltransferase [Candidatus Magnetaquicoccus inordinatus]|uniref:class I SAM-dependent methyltransferase n=1 Tax=Candidatus Magnetaquicoccus inordinatus TaxID=2496818 RepID=UPI00102C1D57|nr:SAM-dependent methyltransferase [Candidatus Magnetaquicoccus inordinatus]
MMHTLLQQAIQEAGGLLPFHSYMRLVLYHPQYGYYMKQHPRLGRSGDFVTAPEMTSLFGELLTLQWIEIWQRLGEPATFELVEAGAGSGRLALDIYRTAQRFPAFAAALSYTILEISPDFCSAQQKLLQQAGCPMTRFRWCNTLDELEEKGVEGVIFSNEFLDAFPVHWVEMHSEGLRELAVVQEEQGLSLAVMPVAAPLHPDHFMRLGITLPLGMRTEVACAANVWMAQAARILRRGVIVSIDYGLTRAEYYHSTALPQGTLTGFFRHQQINNPLLHPGEMDLTSHVHFTDLAEVGEEQGLYTIGYTTQAWFLMGLGILQRLEQLARSQSVERMQEIRQTVMRLLMPQGMGERFKVLMQGRNFPHEPLPAGFSLHNAKQRLLQKNQG